MKDATGEREGSALSHLLFPLAFILSQYRVFAVSYPGAG